MKPSPQSTVRARQAGFSLIELMVGLTIGMIAAIVIIQVMSVFEAQRRSTTGTADAQTNGGIALYSVSRELQMAGYPLTPATDSPLECTTVTSNVAGITTLSPVTITNGTATSSVPASDSITVRYGTSSLGGATAQITFWDAGNKRATVGSNLGCQLNDILVVISGSSCAITKATAVSAAGASPITVDLENATLAAQGANIACLGTWNEVTYSVDPTTNNLVRTANVNGAAGTATPNTVGIVNIQAQYGISGSVTSNQVTSWVSATGGTWAAPTVPNRNLIKAVRLAVIARNAKIEQEATTAACSSTTAANPAGLCAWDGSGGSAAPTVDLSPGNPSWNKYHYRVFGTIVPLRNVMWAKDTL